MKPISRIQSGWEFLPFRLDQANATLWRDDKVVPLRPKSFAALCYLIERNEQLVTKDELMEAVWQNRCVGQAVLKVCINELRQVLGDNAQAPTYLNTIPRRGYRFIAAVTEIQEIRSEEPAASVISAPSGGQRSTASGCWIGGESAQAKLLAIWQSALESVRQVVFVTGEPGIGKTTLIEMFLEQVSEYSPMVLRMRCVKHFGEGEALMPMIEAMEKRCRGPEGAKLIELMQRYAPVWLAQLPSVLKPDERETLQRQIFGASRERMVREGCELLEALSKERPLILVLEDLHWSDHATMDFLSLLARRHESAPLMVMATYRPVDADLRAHSVTLIHRELQMKNVCSEIELAPFSLEEVKAYLARRFPHVVIPDSVSQALFARTGGLPLFVSSLTEYLVSQQEDWPLSHQTVMDKRAARDNSPGHRARDRALESGRAAAVGSCQCNGLAFFALVTRRRARHGGNRRGTLLRCTDQTWPDIDYGRHGAKPARRGHLYLCIPPRLVCRGALSAPVRPRAHQAALAHWRVS